MTATLISLISIFAGIITANTFGLIYKKFAFDFIGNSIAGVFGSIFFIKSFGRLGFAPNHIMASGTTNYYLLAINLLISVAGGIIAVILIKKLEHKLN